MTSVLITSNISIDGAGKELKRFLEKENTFRNPAYDMAIRQGRSVRYIEEFIRTYQDDEWLTLPRGYRSTLLNLLPDDVTIGDERTVIDVSYPSLRDVTLRSYQENAINDMLSDDDGILVAPTGSGKTIMGLALLARLGQRAMVLVHTKELAKQWRAVIHEKLGIEAGIIGDGKWNEGEIITVAMLQTLNRNQYRVDEIAENYGAVLVDECHHISAATFAEVMSWLPAKYRYGLSATPHRRDGLDVLINRVIGPTLAEIDKADVEAVGGTVPATVKILETDFTPVDVESWGDFIDQIVCDDGRNAYIVSVAKKAAAKIPTLVLVDRVAHAIELSDMAGDCVLIHGGLSKQERATAMTEVKTARLTIGTTGLLGEGLDVARWSALIMASPISSRTKLLQAIGRIVRPYAGKVRGYVADIVDNHPLAFSSLGKRRAIYQEQGISIIR